jgi:hypothetical protein
MEFLLLFFDLMEAVAPQRPPPIRDNLTFVQCLPKWDDQAKAIMQPEKCRPKENDREKIQ